MLPGKKFFISLGLALFIGNYIDFEKKQTRWEMFDQGCEMLPIDPIECRSAMIMKDKAFYDETWISESLYWLIIIMPNKIILMLYLSIKKLFGLKILAFPLDQI